MSKVEMHAPFKHYRGTIGDLVYKKYRGKTVVALKPEGKRQASQAQTEHQQNFGQASTWAKAVLKDQELGPFYKALGEQRDIPAYAAAMSDALKRPSIEELDLSQYAGKAGDRIYFKASDNVGLVKAFVTIGDGNSLVYEGGNAVEVEPGTKYWMYTARTAIKAGATVVVNVEVADRPRNVVELMEEITL